jgi:hypothetical protein
MGLRTKHKTLSQKIGQSPPEFQKSASGSKQRPRPEALARRWKRVGQHQGDQMFTKKTPKGLQKSAKTNVTQPIFV